MSNYALEAIATMLNLCMISNYFVPSGMKNYVRYHLGESIKRITLRTLTHKLREIADDDDSSQWMIADKIDDLPVSYWYVTTENYLNDTKHIADKADVYNLGMTILYEYEDAIDNMGKIDDSLSLWGDTQ